MTEAANPPITVFDDSVSREADEQARSAVASAGHRVESAGGVNSEVRPAMYRLLSSVADNKHVLGRRYAEWCTGAPMLEAAVAAAAMAQDELGHARSFYPLLRGFPESSATDTMEEAGWQTRPTSAMACLDPPFESWCDFVAANLLIDGALTALFEAAIESPYEPLRQRARKIVQEEESHRVHALSWVRRLGASLRERKSLTTSLVRMADDVQTWFGHGKDPVIGALHRSGQLAIGPDRLRARLAERVSPVLTEIGLADLLSSATLPWARWDETFRRLHAS